MFHLGRNNACANGGLAGTLTGPLRHVIGHLAITGGMAVGDSLVQQMLGHGSAAIREVALRTTSPSWPAMYALLRSAFLNGGRGLSNYVDNDIRLGEHRHVAARHLGDDRSHAL